MLVTKTIEFDMGHRVPNHKSQCRNFHGHRYKVEVGVDDKLITTAGSSDEGMVIDFGDLKQVLMGWVHGVLDHSFMMYEKDEFYEDFYKIADKGNFLVNFVRFIPTAENIAKYIWELIEPELRQRGVKLYNVKVWETPNSTATYVGN